MTVGVLCTLYEAINKPLCLSTGRYIKTSQAGANDNTIRMTTATAADFITIGNCRRFRHIHRFSLY